ncbi:V0D/AC39 family V-type ATPase subunit [Treponema sp.]|uniref:V0D/AC39 family V-type ATPase subunit n=1 Tax=Treponema sp. TaxID=166 RepID=UPI003EFDD830
MAMDKSAADSYVYAKASGMLARSYVGERARQLFSFRTLQELWAFLFKKEIPVVPETLLARNLEQEAFRKFIYDYKKLVENYSKPEDIVLTLLRNFDYENLKDISASLALGEKKMPSVQRIEPFNIINYDGWPDISSITSGGDLSWYNEIPSISEMHLADYKLDCHYIMSLWNAAKRVHSSCRNDVLDLLGEKIRIDNVVWAIRLRFYYKMERDEILPLLAYTTEQKDAEDPLACDAIKTLDWELDNYDSWKDWKYSRLLNPHEEGTVWTVDSRWISNSYKGLYVKKAYKLFHKYPFTACPLVCWFIIKRNELDNIRTASESLRLSIDSLQAMQMAGALEVING